MHVICLRYIACVIFFHRSTKRYIGWMCKGKKKIEERWDRDEKELTNAKTSFFSYCVPPALLLGNINSGEIKAIKSNKASLYFLE